MLQGERAGDLPRLDQLLGRGVDAAEHRLGEMLRPQEVRNPLIGPVVCQDRAEEGRLALGVVGRRAVGGAVFRATMARRHIGGRGRSEKRAVGNECVRTCRSWWAQYHYNNKK